MTAYLLDINLLIALSDPMHVHHEGAHGWFEARGSEQWATCPLTENGYVRITSHPRYPNRPGDVPAVVGFLRQLCAVGGHEFWPEDITVRELLGPDRIITHAQVTDVYLLALCVRRGGKLATLDRRLPTHAVQGGEDALELISVLTPPE